MPLVLLSRVWPHLIDVRIQLEQKSVVRCFEKANLTDSGAVDNALLILGGLQLIHFQQAIDPACSQMHRHRILRCATVYDISSVASTSNRVVPRTPLIPIETAKQPLNVRSVVCIACFCCDRDEEGTGFETQTGSNYTATKSTTIHGTRPFVST